MNMMKHIPFWAFIGMILCLVHHPQLGGIPHGFDFSGITGFRQQASTPVHMFAGEQVRRQLEAASSIEEEKSAKVEKKEEEKEAADEKSAKVEKKEEDEEAADTKKDGSEKDQRQGWIRYKKGWIRYKDGAEKDQGKGKEPAGVPDFIVSVPCASFLWFGPILKPCGNVTIGPKGVDIKTPFGTKHIPGTNLIKPYVKQFEKSFEHYTAYFVGGGAALYALMVLVVKSKRDEFIQNIKDVFAGKMKEDDPTEEKGDAEADMADRLDVKSDNFIAPGNIYRLLAVLHPGKVGFQQWTKWAFKASVCAYMQLYLPYKIIMTVLAQWHFHGFKSPLYFVSQGGAFATMFISVGSLCNLFASKCADSIRIGAEANVHILWHGEDHAANAAAAAAKAKEAEAKSAEEAGTQGSYAPIEPTLSPRQHTATSRQLQILPIPPISTALVTANEYFWCLLSFACNVGMSFLLFGAMFLKIATFTGNISQVAMVAVALYFVFDLDGKVMDSDAALRPRYRRAVVKQVLQKDYKPVWLLAAAATCRAILNGLTPFGLAMIVLVSWSNDNEVIGGDPF